MNFKKVYKFYSDLVMLLSALYGSLCSLFYLDKIIKGKYKLTLFEYEPTCYFLLEFDMTLSGIGSFEVVEKEGKQVAICKRSVLHIVIFRTRFSLGLIWEEDYSSEIKTN